MNIKGMKTKSDFEVIEVLDDYDPYLALLGIDWAFDNNVVLNLKKQMSFETDTLLVLSPLDPYGRDRYNDPVDEDVWRLIIKKIYKIIGNRADYINLVVDGELCLRSVNSYDTDFEDALERWKNKLYEVSTCRCARITKAICWIGSELCDTLCLDGTVSVEAFLI
jgi:hypothetical protein